MLMINRNHCRRKRCFHSQLNYHVSKKIGMQALNCHVSKNEDVMQGKRQIVMLGDLLFIDISRLFFSSHICYCA